MFELGPYHIVLPDTVPNRVRVRCYEESSNHRHRSHMENQAKAICGAELVENKHGFCSLSIANPTWDKN